MKFIPEIPKHEEKAIPFFEDQEGIGGKYVTKTSEVYKKRLISLLTQLGAYQINVLQGKYDNRQGVLITFLLGTLPGRIECAALPVRIVKNRDKAMAQALWLLGNWLEAELNSIAYRPGSMPLVPYLIGTGDMTVMESLREYGEINLLPSGKMA